MRALKTACGLIVFWALPGSTATLELLSVYGRPERAYPDTDRKTRYRSSRRLSRRARSP